VIPEHYAAVCGRTDLPKHASRGDNDAASPMTSDRKKPTTGFWITVALVAVLLAYPLSFGPACWIESRFLPDGSINSRFSGVYRPLLRVVNGGALPPWWQSTLFSYANLAADSKHSADIGFERKSQDWPTIHWRDVAKFGR